MLISTIKFSQNSCNEPLGYNVPAILHIIIISSCTCNKKYICIKVTSVVTFTEDYLELYFVLNIFPPNSHHLFYKILTAYHECGCGCSTDIPKSLGKCL